jgi:protein-S-isoprenylcysteine O-methyltransferase Ste14
LTPHDAESVMNAVTRSIAGGAFLAIAVALMLFIPAGTIRYWQGWVYWLVFFASVTVITVYFLKHDPGLIERRTHAGPIAEPETSQKIIQAAASLLFCAQLIVPGLDYRYGWSAVPVPLVIAGDVLIAISFAIVFIVFMENSYAASIVKVESEQRVISTGLYARVRHPMYAGALLGLLATPLALGSWWALPIPFAFCAVIAMRLLDEERRLAAELPGYDDYCRKVHSRLLPGVW